MLRTQVVKLARATSSTKRSFTMSAVRAAEGDTGAMRSGGSASRQVSSIRLPGSESVKSNRAFSDAFNRREQASENKFIREREMESLRKLKEKLAAQRKHLDELDEHIKELESERGGEQ